MEKPAVSVIMPVYNGREYLKDSLDSICGQTLKNIEIICVNDGSTDDSLEILRAYARKDSRVRVVDQANSDAGHARNHGMEYAVGEYLSILDCDDFYERDMLELAYKKAKRLDLDMVAFGCDQYENATRRFTPIRYSVNWYQIPLKPVFSAEDIQKDVFKLFVGWAWDKLFNAAFVREHQLQFQSQRTTNDMLFVFSALTLAKRIGVIDRVLVHHRKASGTLSVTREKSWHCFHDALSAVKAHLEVSGLYSRFKRDYINYCLHFSLWHLNTLAQPTRDLLYVKLKTEWFREFEIPDHGWRYFYNKQEYLQYRQICSCDPGEEPNQILKGAYIASVLWETGKKAARYYTGKLLHIEYRK